MNTDIVKWSCKYSTENCEFYLREPFLQKEYENYEWITSWACVNHSIRTIVTFDDQHTVIEEYYNEFDFYKRLNELAKYS